MKELKNALGIIFAAIWTVSLGILMFRLPIATVLSNSQMYQELSVESIDIVLSVVFCLVGIVSSVVGYFFKNKTLSYLSLIHWGLALVAVLTLFLYFVTVNADVFAVFLYLANPFLSVLVAEGVMLYVYSLPVFTITLVLLPILHFLLASKLKKTEQHKTRYRASIATENNQGSE